MCVIQWDCYSSCVLVVVPGEDQFVCVCLCVNQRWRYISMWLRELVIKVLINPTIRTRTRNLRLAYHPICDNIIMQCPEAVFPKFPGLLYKNHYKTHFFLLLVYSIMKLCVLSSLDLITAFNPFALFYMWKLLAVSFSYWNFTVASFS
jgi:hypothetical protein